MAFSMNRMHEHDLFVAQMKGAFPGARPMVSIRGWEDPRPEFSIEFKNGVRFESNTKHKVIAQAKAYFDATVRLTGEPP
jgi:hypothetical protein